MSMKTAILFLFITIFTQLRESEGLTTTIKSHLQPKSSKWLDYQSGGKDFVYSMCNNTAFKPIDTLCTISMESISFHPLWTCNITIPYTHETGIVVFPVRVLQFGHNKAVLIWSTNKFTGNRDISVMNFVVLHFTSCRTTEIFSLTMELSFYYILNLPVWTYDDGTFDIVYYSIDDCGSKSKSCKVTINAEGKRIAGPVPWINVYRDGKLGSFPLTQTRSKGYLLLNNNWTSIDVAIITKDGHESKKLASYKHTRNLIHSTAHHTIGICYNYNDNLWRYYCKQYTLSGDLKLKTDMNLPYHKGYSEDLFYRPTLYNLPNGGFLLMNERSNGEWVDLMKVDGNGQVIGSLNITGFYCSAANMLAIKFFENESKKQCLTLACHDQNIFAINLFKSLDFHITCFTNEDFQKSFF